MTRAEARLRQLRPNLMEFNDHYRADGQPPAPAMRAAANATHHPRIASVSVHPGVARHRAPTDLRDHRQPVRARTAMTTTRRAGDLDGGL
jgi:hypothetical protein